MSQDYVGSSGHSARKDSSCGQIADSFGTMPELDDTDRQIIALLSTNARMPVAKLAQKLGLARTTAQARLDRLERTGVIAGYTLRLSEDALRGQIRATVLVHITPSAQTAVLGQLRRLTAVERVHTTSGRFDLACQLRAGSTGELDHTLDSIGEIEGVVAMETLVHLSTRIDRAV
jgi:DNA-binding Lrp family transcriptional regulator